MSRAPQISDATVDRIAERAAQVAIERVSQSQRDELEQFIHKVTKDAAREAAQTAVTETLITLGLDPKERKELVKDFIFLNELRKTFADGKKHALFAFIGLSAALAFAAMLAYFKTSPAIAK